MSGLSRSDRATIQRFAETFNKLYGSKAFSSMRRLRGMRVDNELNALVCKVIKDQMLYGDFLLALSDTLNNLRGPSSNLTVTETADAVREALGFTADAKVMIIFENDWISPNATNRQKREWWTRTRVFKLSPRSIHIVRLDADDIAKLVAA